MFSKAVKRTKPSGLSLEFLAEAELPEDLSWAKNSPIVAEAFSRWAAVVEDAGNQVLSSEIRELVFKYIQNWKGEDPGLGRRWAEKAINGYDDKSKAEGILALLTAIAPYQIDEIVIQRFRDHFPKDDQLISALAWSSFIAARKIGTWISSY